MNKKLLIYTAGGFLFVSIAGTLCHFLYEWSGNNALAGLFCPVNESIWEHIKLLFFPMLAYILFCSKPLRQEYPCAVPGLFAGLLAGCLLIPVLYYTYTGILGFSVTAVDIGIFFVSTAAAFAIACLLIPHRFSRCAALLLTAAVILLAGCFVWFTFFPPDIPLFEPPASSPDAAAYPK